MMCVLSDIYPPDIKPVRDGLYITLIREDSGAMSIRTMRCWNGGFWSYEWQPGIPCPGQGFHWQGLAFDPDEATKASRWVPTDDADGWVSGVFVPGATCDD